MFWLFVICATVGGTILVCQFALAILGLGFDANFGDDLPSDGAGDFHDLSPTHDVSSGDTSEHGPGHGNFSTWLFGILSLKTIVTALAFFGLAGCAARSAGFGAAEQLGIAILSGAAAMYVVHWLMQVVARLSRDGTARIDHAIGHLGKVTVAIPPRESGQGKIQFVLDKRLVEYAALSSDEETLLSGDTIRIVNLLGDNVLKVERAAEPKPSMA